MRRNSCQARRLSLWEKAGAIEPVSGYARNRDRARLLTGTFLPPALIDGCSWADLLRKESEETQAVALLVFRWLFLILGSRAPKGPIRDLGVYCRVGFTPAGSLIRGSVGG